MPPLTGNMGGYYSALLGGTSAAPIDVLSVVRGESGAWPLQIYTDAGAVAAGVFTSGNALTCELYQGDDAVLATVPTAAWISAPAAQYQAAVTGTQTTALTPGNYTLLVTVAVSGMTPAVLYVPFLVLPAPAGTGTLRSLATPADFYAMVPAQTGNPAVSFALASATRAIEAFCRRPLVLTTFDKFYRPGRTRKIYLDTWPVAIVTIVSADLTPAFTVTNQNVNATALASFTMQRAGIWSQPLTPVSMTFVTIANNVPTTQVVTFSGYPTIVALVAGINALGNGWSATLNPGGEAPYNIGDWPPSWLSYQMGTFGALDEDVEVNVYMTQEWRYVVHDIEGYIEMTRNYPEAYRYADRAFGMGYGFSWTAAGEPRNANVRVAYRAGYATTQADIAAGFEPVQEDLKMACIMTAQAILNSTPMMGNIQSQSVEGRSYTLKQAASMIPQEVRPLLNRYNNYRLGGWGF
jgi:hypothetical protein